MARLAPAVALIAFLGVTPARAEPTTNGDMSRICDKAAGEPFSGTQEIMNLGDCWGFIRGVWEMHVAWGTPPLVCLPPGADYSQMAKVYLKWTRDNPAKLHEKAVIGAFAAWREAFPCPKP